MDGSEARRVDVALRAAGIAGVVAPVDADNAAGPYAVYDSADVDQRQDITAATVVALADAYMKRDEGGPTRGFVVS